MCYDIIITMESLSGDGFMNTIPRDCAISDLCTHNIMVQVLKALSTSSQAISYNELPYVPPKYSSTPNNGNPNRSVKYLALAGSVVAQRKTKSTHSTPKFRPAKFNKKEISSTDKNNT